MFNREELRELASHSSTRFPLTSFFWKVPPKTNRSPRDAALLVRDLLREARQKLEDGNHSREWARSLETDQQKILDYFNQAQDGRTADTALFSCSGDSYWRDIRLPRGLSRGLFVGETFYLQPLSVLLDQYPRYCTVLLDRAAARIFEIYMGELVERTTLLDEVPGKVKAATWTGGNERQIERHTEGKVHQHYKHVAELVLQLFQKLRFDWLILEGHADGLAAFENHLHSTLRARLIGRVAADMRAATPQEILAKSMEIVEARDGQEKQALVEDILNKANQGGLGVSGLPETLQALELGQVHTLVVDETLQVSAWLCHNCGALALAEAATCPQCQGLVERLEDAVERAVEDAIRDNSQIRFVKGNEKLRQAGGIAALLRFRAVKATGASS